MERPSLVSLLAGIMLIFRHKLLLGAISLDLFAVLFSGAVALLPVFAKDILHTGAEGLGILRSAPGLGAVFTSIVLTQWPLKRHVGLRLFFAVGIFGLCVIYLRPVARLRPLRSGVGRPGLADNVKVDVRGSIVPLATPDGLVGRVVAVDSVFIGASDESGAFVAGSGAALPPLVVAVVVGGSLTLGVALLWSAMFPSPRRVDRMELIQARAPPGFALLRSRCFTVSNRFEGEETMSASRAISGHRRLSQGGAGGARGRRRLGGRRPLCPHAAELPAGRGLRGGASGRSRRQSAEGGGAGAV